MKLSMVMERLSTLERAALVLTISSVLLSLSLKKFEVNQDLISVRQWEGGGSESGLYQQLCNTMSQYVTH